MRNITYIKRLIYYIIYTIIQIIIAIGEGTRFVLYMPFMFLRFIAIVIYRRISSLTFIKHLNETRPKKIKKPKDVVSSAARSVWHVVFMLSRCIRFVFTALWWILTLPGRMIQKIVPERVRTFLWGFALCLILVFVYQMYTTVKNLPTPKDIGKLNYSLSTHIYDRKGRLLYEVYRDENRTPIKLKEMPWYVTKAAISIEDKDYYKHSGISVSSGMLRAVRDMITYKNLQGGSTITQQLVKSALLTPERTLQRKLKEIVLAVWTERVYSKDQILEMYLNQVPYGGSSYGIEEAAKTYFGKQARELTLGEAALLAGLPQAPSVYSPFINPQLAVQRRNDVLDKMYEYRYITRDQLKTTKAEKLSVIPPDTLIKAPHFVFYVKSQLEQQFGTRMVEEGGLRVYTTLDLDVQQQAEKILGEELAKIKNLNVSNGAILVSRPSTGEILAMVGSADYFQAPSGAFNVVTALRQPGSSIKPIMYSLAMQKGYTAATVIDDSPVSYTSDIGEVYRPVNYDGKFHGKVTLRMALGNSFNIPAVKVLNAVGVDQFVDYARTMGITTWQDPSRYGLSLTLGGVEVRMIDMATAFGVFANKGSRVQPNFLMHIEDSRNNTIASPTPSRTNVTSSGIAYVMSDMLSDNFARILEFGPNSALQIPGYKVAVKTGTTDEKKDNWTIGYTPQYLVAVWVGNNDNSPMNPYLASGITGAAPIWNRVMSYVIKQYDTNYSWFATPEDVVQKTCFFGKKEYFVKGTENTVNCSSGSKAPTVTGQ